MRSAVTFEASLALILALLSACGSSSNAPRDELVAGQTLVLASSEGAAKGHVQLDGDRIVEGKNAFFVEFEPAATELVSASALMPVHGHGADPPTVSRTSTGYRVGDLNLPMAGLWDVFLDVRVAAKTDRIEFTVDVP